VDSQSLFFAAGGHIMRLFTIGPVEMFDEIKDVRKRGDAVPYFRTPEFSDMMLETDRLLRKFAKTGDSSRTIYLTASGTAAMEAAVLNCFTREDRLLVIDGGTFGHRFVKICKIHKIPHDVITLDFGETLAKKHFEAASHKAYTALLVNVDETSTGQLYDMALISDFCKDKGMYLVADAISSFLCDEFDMDGYGVDVMIASSQKGPCVSPGMSVALLSERILKERVMKSAFSSLYFDFKSYLENFKRGQTPFTPAVGICVELNVALRMIDRIGLEQHLSNIETIAKDFRSKLLDLPVSIPSYPLSNAVTPVIFDEPIAYRVFEYMKDRYGIYVNPTGGKLGETTFRVAHIGKITTEDNSLLISRINEGIEAVKSK